MVLSPCGLMLTRHRATIGEIVPAAYKRHPFFKHEKAPCTHGTMHRGARKRGTTLIQLQSSLKCWQLALRRGAEPSRVAVYDAPGEVLRRPSARTTTLETPCALIPIIVFNHPAGLPRNAFLL